MKHHFGGFGNLELGPTLHQTYGNCMELLGINLDIEAMSIEIEIIDKKILRHVTYTLHGAKWPVFQACSLS